MANTYGNQSVISRQVRGDAGSSPVLTTKTLVNFSTHTAVRWAKLDTIPRSWE